MSITRYAFTPNNIDFSVTIIQTKIIDIKKDDRQINDRDRKIDIER